ncbi:hypothetical protein CI238_03198, partial [Colletotrichum incanum]
LPMGVQGHSEMPAHGAMKARSSIQSMATTRDYYQGHDVSCSLSSLVSLSGPSLALADMQSVLRTPSSMELIA